MDPRANVASVDDAIARVARAEGALDVAFGEGLVRLFQGGRLLALSYATERDYARERLGLPVRTMQNALALARACNGRPLLRKAVAAGVVSPCKARAIAPVVAQNEAGWTALAMTSTVRELHAAVRAAGKEPPEELEGESLRMRMSPAQQDKLDAALRLADEVQGCAVPRWICYEALAQEWLSEHGEWAPEAEDEGVRGPELGQRAKPLPDRVTEHLAVIEEARALVEDRAPETTDPKLLDAFVLRVLKARRENDLILGPLALRVVNERVWAAIGHPTLEDYVTERLGLTPSVFRQRVWLERRMLALPPLREALEAGTLTYSKALLVAQDATPGNVAERIAAAAGTTWQQTERETTAREDKRNRAMGIRRVWAPSDVMQTITAAIVSAQRWSESRGRRIDEAEALVLVADHFVEVWSKHRRKHRTKAREAVFRRTQGRCSVPGCSLPGRHMHHIRYRSHGGTDDPSETTLLCIPHHLRAVHMGFLKVEGRAGERLIWHFGSGEIFVTTGDDDVCRAEAGAVSEPGAGGHARWMVTCDIGTTWPHPEQTAA
jgi:hypothetical protein